MKLNMCERDLINNLQQIGKRQLYKVGLNYALMDVGNFRKFQEDSILVTAHKEVSDAEMLLVADGMGGLENGARASRLSAQYLMNWFHNLSFDDLNKTSNLKKQFSDFINKLDEIIRQECGQGGTTLVCAFAVGDSIIIANIGDSRAYAYSDGKLTQITTDHSITQHLFSEGIIKKKSHIRFHKKNNLILSRIGCEKKLLELDFYEVSKADIDKLFLFSDGITDCISDEQLTELICQNSDEEICNSIIDVVLSTDSFAINLDPNDYYDKICAGKDNASIVYRKNRRVKND